MNLLRVLFHLEVGILEENAHGHRENTQTLWKEFRFESKTTLLFENN